MNNYQKYVEGFLFSEDRSKVVLVIKNRPEKWKGLVNGIGGKIENDESLNDAMLREFEEETGDSVDHNWEHFLTLNGTWGEVNFFRAFGNTTNCKTTESEEIIIVNVNEVDNLRTFPNLKWIIPLALDRDVKFGKVSEIW